MLLGKPGGQLPHFVQQALQSVRIRDQQHSGQQQRDGDLSHASSIAPAAACFFYHRPVKLLFILTLIGAVGLLPFVAIRRPWAVRLWQRFKLIIAIYAIVILVAAIVRLVFNWDDIYG